MSGTSCPWATRPTSRATTCSPPGTTTPGHRAALYLESFGNARKFARFARRFTERKPLLAVVGGRSKSGGRGPASRIPPPQPRPRSPYALFAQSGVIGCIGRRRPGRGGPAAHPATAPRRSPPGVLSNAGGMGVLVADAAEACDLVVPEFTTTRAICWRAWSTGRPGRLTRSTRVPPRPRSRWLRSLKQCWLQARSTPWSLLWSPPATPTVSNCTRARRRCGAHPESPWCGAARRTRLRGVRGVTTYGSRHLPVRAMGRAAAYASGGRPAAPRRCRTDPQPAARQWCRSRAPARSHQGRWLAGVRRVTPLDPTGSPGGLGRAVGDR